jgi:RHS repeat-associated protein
MDQLPFGEDAGGSGESSKFKFTTYERDAWLDYAVNRHYNPRQGRFIQADPLRMGAASSTNPQSLNLYSYSQNDPINAFDPLGTTCSAEYSYSSCGGGGGFWGGGGGGFGDHVAKYNSKYGGLSSHIAEGMEAHDERVDNARAGRGFKTNEEIEADDSAQQRQQNKRKEKPQKKQNEQQKSPLQGPPVATGDVVVDAGILVLTAIAIAIAVWQENGMHGWVDNQGEFVDIKDDYVIVRGGATNEPPMNGQVFSGAFGFSIFDAGKGVPHNKLSHTTAGEIRNSGGTVFHKVEEAYPGGPNNLRHVNITLGDKNPFVGPIENPVPRNERIPTDPNRKKK